MATYNLFRMDSQGHITSREEHECANNSDALETARTLMDGHDIEVWLGNIRIGAVNRRFDMPEGEALLKLRRPLNLV
jgi:hypothetical protein